METTTTAVQITPELQAQVQKIINRRTMYAAGTGLIPFPIIDAAALLGVQIYMIRDIAQVHEVAFKEERVKSIIAILVGDVATVGLFKIIPGLGTFFGSASAAAAGAAATYALGSIFSQHFSEGGTLLDFDAEKSKTAFKQEFEKGKKAVVDLKNKATGKGKSKEEGTLTQTLLEKNKDLHAELITLREEVAALRDGPKESGIDLTNLRLIEGIGSKVEAALNEGGIGDLKQLAETSVEDIKAILLAAEGNFKLMVPDSWPMQAKLAVTEDLDALKQLQDTLIRGREA